MSCAPAPAVLATGLLAACFGAPDAGRGIQGPVDAIAAVDRADVAFGDDLTLTLEVRSDPELQLELDHPASFDGFRMVDQGRIEEEVRDGRVERRWYRLRPERAGSLTLPALTVRHRPAHDGAVGGGDDGPAWGTVSTEPIAVAVSSRLPAAADAALEIRDIKPLQPIDRGSPWALLAAAIAMVMALAALLALAARRRARPAPAPAATPAHEIALAALARLGATELSGDDAVRRFYFALSEIVRTYVEGRFGLNATDLTTEEIVGALDRLELPDGGASSLREFLRDSDHVKFAAHRPARSEVSAILDRARRFVEDTRPEEPRAPGAGVREAA
ncbi:MAG TPA: BatD family protein [Thermoanaerobaculia bacterium]|nr:BatD family protein [Thermoanaerobaculia bacterium]